LNVSHLMWVSGSSAWKQEQSKKWAE